jgi:hypothetical protein
MDGTESRSLFVFVCVRACVCVEQEWRDEYMREFAVKTFLFQQQQQQEEEET